MEEGQMDSLIPSTYMCIFHHVFFPQMVVLLLSDCIHGCSFN